MEPTDKFGNTIYPRTYGKLQIIGKALQESEWRESTKKPNLFYKKFGSLMVFADMRGTEIVPIWEEPYPLIYASRDGEDWKRRRALRLATSELEALGVPTRYSFFETCEPEGLFFGEENELPDGSCRLCGKEFDKGELFCSENCEKAYSQLEELRREESECKVKCALCGTILDTFSSDRIKHHVSYQPERVIDVCRSCHRKIHTKHNDYPNLAPKKPKDWKKNPDWL